MFQSFSDVLSTPQSKGLVTFGFLARSPMGMRAIAVLLFVEQQTGSYAVAGLAMGVMTAAQAIVGPLLGRAVDTVGPQRVLILAAVGHVVFGSLLAFAVWNDWSTVYAVLLSGLTGGTIAPVGAIVRGRWVDLLQARPDRLRTAYSVESSIDEVIYIGGPILAVALAHGGYPVLGFALTVAVTGVGSLLLGAARVLSLRSPRRATVRRGEQSTPRVSVRKVPGLAAILLGYAGLGIFLGATDVAVVASAGEYAGWILGALGAGSLFAALVLGALPSRLNLIWVRSCSGLLMAISCAAAFWLESPLALALLLGAAGLAVSPTLVIGADTLRSMAPPRQISEMFTWSSSILVASMGFGSFSAGLFSDTVPGWGFLVAVLGGLLAGASGLNDLRLTRG